MSKIQYKVVNTTKWPGVKKGKHKNGFILAINRRSLHVNHHLVVDEITEGIEALQKKRYVKVEPIADRVVTIKEEVEKTEAENDKVRAEQEKKIKAEQKKAQADAKKKAEEEAAELAAAQTDSAPASSVDKDEMKKQVKASRPENTARVAGEDDSTDPLDDIEQATDDNPNFVVKAGKSRGKRNRKKNG